MRNARPYMNMTSRDTFSSSRECRKFDTASEVLDEHLVEVVNHNQSSQYF
jgi:hypothetical protein